VVEYINKKWFVEEVKRSNLPILVSDLHLETLIDKAMKCDIGTYTDFEVIASATAFIKTGIKRNIDDKLLKKIFIEAFKIVENAPNDSTLLLKL